jgi:putative membrane protein
MSSIDSSNRLVVLVLVLLGILFVFPLLGMGFGVMGFGHMGGGMWGGGMWGDGSLPVWLFGFAAVMQLAFLGVVAVGAYLLYRAVTSDSEATDAALEELRQAYARGDLTDEEFERRRERLEREP